VSHEEIQTCGNTGPPKIVSRTETFLLGPQKLKFLGSVLESSSPLQQQGHISTIGCYFRHKQGILLQHDRRYTHICPEHTSLRVPIGRHVSTLRPPFLPTRLTDMGSKDRGVWEARLGHRTRNKSYLSWPPPIGMHLGDPRERVRTWHNPAFAQAGFALCGAIRALYLLNIRAYGL
jgi:hypothetical protein